MRCDAGQYPQCYLEMARQRLRIASFLEAEDSTDSLERCFPVSFHVSFRLLKHYSCHALMLGGWGQKFEERRTSLSIGHHKDSGDVFPKQMRSIRFFVNSFGRTTDRRFRFAGAS